VPSTPDRETRAPGDTPERAGTRPRGGTRDRILDAAAQVMHRDGLARSTTKQIARAAGYSEATLYKHFDDKTDLFLAVLKERLPPLGGLLAAEPDGSLRDNLVAIAARTQAFYHDSYPIGASLFSEPTLLAAHRAELERRGAGPHKPVDGLTGYLRAEQRAGRIRADADCAAAAQLLIGGCLYHAFLDTFAQREFDPARAEHRAAALVDTLLAGLTPA
jgi:AcrR family transcriptional regulator